MRRRRSRTQQTATYRMTRPTTKNTTHTEQFLSELSCFARRAKRDSSARNCLASPAERSETVPPGTVLDLRVRRVDGSGDDPSSQTQRRAPVSHIDQPARHQGVA